MKTKQSPISESLWSLTRRYLTCFATGPNKTSKYQYLSIIVVNLSHMMLTKCNQHHIILFFCPFYVTGWGPKWVDEEASDAPDNYTVVEFSLGSKYWSEILCSPFLGELNLYSRDLFLIVQEQECHVKNQWNVHTNM